MKRGMPQRSGSRSWPGSMPNPSKHGPNSKNQANSKTSQQQLHRCLSTSVVVIMVLWLVIPLYLVHNGYLSSSKSLRSPVFLRDPLHHTSPALRDSHTAGQPRVASHSDTKLSEKSPRVPSSNVKTIHKDNIKSHKHDNNLYSISEEELIDMRQLNYDLPFDNPDGGAWKQGWKVEPQKVDESHPLKIYVLPHSHCDPGWIKTFDEYFQSQTKSILTTVVNALSQDPRRKFIWAEISYFEWWWREQDETMRDKARKLILETKQLEFVTGGWVQPDEANTQLYAMEIQLQEGHDFLRKTFGEAVIPKFGWSIDPFGYSPTMAYLLNKYGFHAMLIQRVHYAIKKELASRQQLEFVWRQTWDDSQEHDIFTHVMPFYSYDVPHTCGPDPAVCCQFDFARIGGYGGCPWRIPPQSITSWNVKQRAMLLLDQYQKKAALYRSNVVLAPLGDDFRWMTADEAEKQYTNYQQIMDYLNDNVPGVTIQWGTLSDYFTSVMGTFEVPVLKGSFFTYADRDQDYWSGYFTSRVFDKALDRKLERVLYAATSLGATALEMQEHRRALSLFQHHDGVTGTAKNHVVEDYAKRIHTAIHAVQDWIMRKLQPDTKEEVQPCWQSDAPRGLSHNLCRSDSAVYAYNPLATSQYCGDVEIQGNTMEQVNLPCETPGGSSDSIQFDARTGLMVHPVKEEWMVWKVNQGGAYLFFPGRLESYSIADLTIDQGGFVVSTPHWKRTVVERTLSDEFGFEDTVYDFIFETNLQASNEEWFVRFSSSIANQGIFHTDLNGFNFDTHHFRKDMPIQSQVFPMPTLASIDDKDTRMTVLSEHAQGTASLKDGSIDIWLDRRLKQDDNRGLFQGVMDNVPTRTRLRVVLESGGYDRDGEFDITPVTRRMWDELNHPLELFGVLSQEAVADMHETTKRRMAETTVVEPPKQARSHAAVRTTVRSHRDVLASGRDFGNRFDKFRRGREKLAGRLSGHEDAIRRAMERNGGALRPSVGGDMVRDRLYQRRPAPEVSFRANGTLTEPFIPIVFMVYNRVDYFKKAIESLQASDFNVTRVPIIISHDGHVPDMIEYVETLKKSSDFDIVQLFHPYSCYDHPNSFPGNIENLNLELFVDRAGNGRDWQATCCKHHFTWMLKTVFELDFGEQRPDGFLFMEEDYVVSSTIYRSITLGFDLYRQYSEVHDDLFAIGLDPTDGFSSSVRSGDYWSLQVFRTGPMVLTPDMFEKLRANANDYCVFDDYNWDWTIRYLQDSGKLPNKVLMPGIYQVMHIGSEGMHHEEGEGISRSVRGRMMLSWGPQPFNATDLYISKQRFFNRRHRGGFGGWAHPLDQYHCLGIFNLTDLAINDPALIVQAVDQAAAKAAASTETVAEPKRVASFTASDTPKEPFIPFVYTVSNQTDKFEQSMESLRASDFNTKRVPLIIAHDGHVPDMMQYVETLKSTADFDIVQLFHPFSCWDHPDSFPGDDPSLETSKYQDGNGNKRVSSMTCRKHHFTWMLKTVFALDLHEKHSDGFLFMEEDHLVSPNVYQSVTVGFDLYQQYNEKSVSGANKNGLFGIALDPRDNISKRVSDRQKWTLTEFTAEPIILTSEMFQQIRKNALEYCIFDDYHWDWSIRHLQGLGLLPHNVLIPGEVQVKRIGAHSFGEKRLGPPQPFRGTELYVPKLGEANPHDDGWGGWAHPADQHHCLELFNLTDLANE